MNSPLAIIIGREYLQRVKRKSFIISTLLMPLLMAALMVAPALITMLAGPEEKVIAVIDHSSIVAPKLQNDESLKFVDASGMQLDSLTQNSKYDAVLVIGPRVVDNDSVSLYSHGSVSMQTQMFITDQIKDAVEEQRLLGYNIENLSRILAEVEADISIRTLDIDRAEPSETSSMLSYVIGITMSLILYMFIMIYGQMVMTSIIEEKNNRVLELVVSSVKPFNLMMGKIVGIGLVAITQILIWAVLICGFSTAFMPSLMAEAFSGENVEMMAVMSQLGDPGFVVSMFVYMLVYLIGGYLFYSSFYAAIGSAVDNIQDASQLSSIAVVPIIMGLMFTMMALNDPGSAASVWTSIIPFTSPMVMMARLSFGVPEWQTLLSIGLLYASFIAMIWVCAKIYRVGIFMYGKKPTFVEIMRWARYK